MNNTQPCDNCAKLQAKNDRLKRENNALRQRIKDALNILGAMALQLYITLLETRVILSQKSGVPRARWAYVLATDKLGRWAYEEIGKAITILRGLC